MNITIVSYIHPQLKHIMAYGPQHVQQIRTVVADANVQLVNAHDPKLAQYIAEADVLIMSPLDHRDLIDFSTAKRLQWVQITAAGATDIASRLKDTNILLTSASGVHPVPIAEHVLTFMLMFARQFNVAYATQLNERKWMQDNLVQSLNELYKSTVGIIGFGRIGQRVAKVAKGFDMQVLALHHMSSLPDKNVDSFYEEKSVARLLQASDYIVNCLPLTAETEGFFNSKLLRHIRPTAYFINIGRGKTVVEQDLIRSLKKGQIAGAGLDVFAEEPLPSTSELWHLKNVILTPHYAGWTPRYIDRVIDIFCDNLAQFIANKPMPTLVDKAKGY